MPAASWAESRPSCVGLTQGQCQGLGLENLKLPIFPRINPTEKERLLLCSRALLSCYSPSPPSPHPWPLLPSELLLMVGDELARTTQWTELLQWAALWEGHRYF